MGRTTTTTDSIGATLREARAYRGLSLSQLGRLTGYQPSFISRVERGVRNTYPYDTGGPINGPTTKTIAILAKHLNCSLMVAPNGHWTFVPYKGKE